jgi:CRISPR-associated endonuclease Cas2
MSDFIAKATLIAYDVVQDGPRKRALKLIEPYRTGGQKSMHECFISNHQAQSLAGELTQVINAKTDRVLIAWPHLQHGVYARSRRAFCTL